MINIDRELVDLIALISKILDIEDGEILSHSWQVAYLAKKIAEEVYPYKEKEIFLAGLTHDFGAFDLRIHILHYPSIDSQIGDKDVRAHPLIGSGIISSFPGLNELAKIVIAHHERYDGRGYPLGRRGDEIPYQAQIVRVADSLSFECYLNGRFEKEGVVEYLERECGKEFMPQALESIKKALSGPEIYKIMNEPVILENEIQNYILQHSESSEGFSRMEVYRENILKFLGQVLDAKNSYTQGHSERVARYAVMISLTMELEDEEIELIRIAGILHDIGKLGIPREILEKPAKLNEEEFEFIKRHPEFGIEIVEDVSALKRIIPILLTDQEHWDGSGYPNGLRGEDIPLGARIVLVADAFDAMTTDRPYRRRLSLEEALQELRNCAGKDFDPAVVEVAAKIFTSLNLP